MKRRSTPPEKKALAYKKDHIIGAEYPQAFRRKWPRKRALASRRERRRVRQLLHDVTAPHQSAQRADFPLRPIRRQIVRKWHGSAIPLGIWVRQRTELRASRTAWNFFKQPYHANQHRDRFSAFLAMLTAAVSPQTAAIAQVFDQVLSAPQRAVWRNNILHIDRRYTWLTAFFADESAWEARLRTWIAAHAPFIEDEHATE
jgi:hypothetical protein